jgi:hypothetical protein
MLMEEHRLRMFVNGFLKRPKKDEVMEKWRKFHSDEICTHSQLLLERSGQGG